MAETREDAGLRRMPAAGCRPPGFFNELLSGSVCNVIRVDQETVGGVGDRLENSSALGLFAPDERARVSDAIRRVGAGGRDESFSTVTMDAGERRFQQVLVSPAGLSGLAGGAVIILRDITEIVKADEVMEARLRLLESYPYRSLDELLTEAVDEAERLTGSEIGFLHHMDEDADALTLQVWSTATANRFCKAVGKGLHYSMSKAGVWVDGVRERRPVIHNDYAALPHKRGLPEGHAPVKRELVVPVLRGGRVVAVLGVGNKPSPYVERDVRIAQLFADLSWDIAERKSAEEKAAAAEARSRLAQAAGGVGVFDWDVQANRAHWSEELIKIYGIENAEGLNLSNEWLSLVHPEDMPAAKALFHGLFREQAERYSDEYRIVRRSDGAVRWIANDALILYSPDGLPLQMVGTVRDITGEREARAAIERGRNLLADAQRVGHLGVYEYDVHTDKFESSPALDEIAGFAGSDEKNLAAWLSLVDPYDLERFKAELNTAIGRIEPFEIEYDLVRRSDGERRRVYGTGRPTPRSDGTLRIIGTVQDITRRRMMEAEERLLREKLVQAQKMEALGTLAGGIAHDFNNILAAIQGYAELTLDCAGQNQDLRENTEMILAASRRARDLVRQILTFSRKTEAEVKPVRVDSTLTETLALLKKTVPSNIVFVVKAQTRCTVLGDQTQIQQVILNICANACHAMRGKGGALTVSLDNFHLAAGEPPPSPNLYPGDYARITVADTGPGIRPEILPRIFEPFFTTKPHGEGTGLGLATVHGIVTRIGGAVTVESTPGQGAAFSIFLPLHKQEAASQCLAETAADLPKGKGTILVVDDEQPIVKMTMKMLTRLGYESVQFSSSVAAWEAFSNDPESFDAVLTDLTMPGLSGADLVALIRNRSPSMPILLFTGNADAVDESMVSELGISAVLGKPVAFSRLAELLQALVGDRR